MALFTVGKYTDITMSFGASAKVFGVDGKTKAPFPTMLSVDALKEASFNIEPPTMALAKSRAKWGVYLKSLTLNQSFEGLLLHLFKPTNDIYFTSLAWDYSGAKPFVYPPANAKPQDFIIPMKAKSKRQFIGNGVSLWPAQVVTGALNLVILIRESDQDTRNLGGQLADIHNTVANSKLTALIAAISAAPALATGVAIAEAVNELIGVMGNVMKTNGDESVDLFEGSYGTDKVQQARVEKYDQEAAGIELEVTVS